MHRNRLLIENMATEDIHKHLYNLRSDFAGKELSKIDVDSNPFEQFRTWFDEGVKAEVNELQAMVVTSVSAEGWPSSRVVYLREIDDDGFVFYTNYNSDKGQDFSANPKMSFTFFWPELARQLHVQGSIEKISAERSDNYFASRPRLSQIGAWASEQSESLENRNELELKVEEFTKRFEDQEVPRPPHWGGFKITPRAFEFWQGRPNRLHDRMKYRIVDGQWTVDRVSP